MVSSFLTFTYFDSDVINLVRNSGRARSLGKSMLEPLSDTDRTRSASPPMKIKGSKSSANLRITTLLNDDGNEEGSTKGSNRTKSSNNSRSSKNKTDLQHDIDTPEASSPPTSSSKHLGLYLPYSGLESLGKKSRPLTAHQVALERYRKERVDYILDRRLKHHYIKFRARRKHDGAIIYTWRRCAAAPDCYDSEDDALIASQTLGQGQNSYQNGLISESVSLPTGYARSSSYHWDRDDIGEEAFSMAQTLRRAGRRLDRWDGRSSGFRAVRPVVTSRADFFSDKAVASALSSSSGRRTAVKRENAGERRNSSLPAPPRVSSSKKSARRKEPRPIKHEGIEFAEPVILQEKSMLRHQETADESELLDEMDIKVSGDAAGADNAGDVDIDHDVDVEGGAADMLDDEIDEDVEDEDDDDDETEEEVLNDEEEGFERPRPEPADVSMIDDG